MGASLPTAGKAGKPFANPNLARARAARLAGFFDFSQTLDGRCVRRAEPLPDNAFKAETAGMFEHGRAVMGQMLVESDRGSAARASWQTLLAVDQFLIRKSSLAIRSGRTRSASRHDRGDGSAARWLDCSIAIGQ